MKSEKVPPDLLRHPVDEYLNCDPYQGDESELKCRTIEIVRLKQPRLCTMGKTEHQAGTVIWRERALVDGKFQSNHLCLPHVAITIDFSHCGERDPYEFTCAEAAAYTPPLDDEAPNGT